ncbi:MAG: ATP-dependent sacrificial sulfur transferase LarE [Desulfobacteraceae bacterium]|nr:ATP-dependent sacrificial sulfur transferase LarE [Desulfobacteraceae bacterium]MBC2756796.1 ATP-dependent sacrificial sulfur transferase LarE [Desulfobacteraceae bacterium]
MNDLNLKKKILESGLRKLDSLAVAFSGGVDSTFLLAVAAKIFQGNRKNQKFVAITAVSPVHPQKDVSIAESFANENHIHHKIIYSGEMDAPAFTVNLPDRCYVCKKIIFGQINKIAADLGIRHVAHGVNVDDQSDYRPGMRAAREMNILSPLLDAGLTKKDIRQLSKEMGLSTWNKSASGCLATRVPYGEPINLKKLKMIEKAEIILSDMGFKTCRVRYYNELAKIEVPSDDIGRLLNPSLRHHIIEELKKIGFLYISIDMEGYQSGRLNRSVVSESEI